MNSSSSIKEEPPKSLNHTATYHSQSQDSLPPCATPPNGCINIRDALKKVEQKQQKLHKRPRSLISSVARERHARQSSASTTSSTQSRAASLVSLPAITAALGGHPHATTTSAPDPQPLPLTSICRGGSGSGTEGTLPFHSSQRNSSITPLVVPTPPSAPSLPSAGSSYTRHPPAFTASVASTAALDRKSLTEVFYTPNTSPRGSFQPTDTPGPLSVTRAAPPLPLPLPDNKESGGNSSTQTVLSVLDEASALEQMVGSPTNPRNTTLPVPHAPLPTVRTPARSFAASRHTTSNSQSRSAPDPLGTTAAYPLSVALEERSDPLGDFLCYTVDGARVYVPRTAGVSGVSSSSCSTAAAAASNGATVAVTGASNDSSCHSPDREGGGSLEDPAELVAIIAVDPPSQQGSSNAGSPSFSFASGSNNNTATATATVTGTVSDSTSVSTSATPPTGESVARLLASGQIDLRRATSVRRVSLVAPSSPSDSAQGAAGNNSTASGGTAASMSFANPAEYPSLSLTLAGAYESCSLSAEPAAATLLLPRILPMTRSEEKDGGSQGDAGIASLQLPSNVMDTNLGFAERYRNYKRYQQEKYGVGGAGAGDDRTTNPGGGGAYSPLKVLQVKAQGGGAATGSETRRRIPNGPLSGDYSKGAARDAGDDKDSRRPSVITYDGVSDGTASRVSGGAGGGLALFPVRSSVSNRQRSASVFVSTLSMAVPAQPMPMPPARESFSTLRSFVKSDDDSAVAGAGSPRTDGVQPGPRTAASLMTLDSNAFSTARRSSVGSAWESAVRGGRRVVPAFVYYRAGDSLMTLQAANDDDDDDDAATGATTSSAKDKAGGGRNQSTTQHHVDESLKDEEDEGETRYNGSVSSTNVHAPSPPPPVVATESLTTNPPRHSPSEQQALAEQSPSGAESLRGGTVNSSEPEPGSLSPREGDQLFSALIASVAPHGSNSSTGDGGQQQQQQQLATFRHRTPSPRRDSSSQSHSQQYHLPHLLSPPHSQHDSPPRELRLPLASLTLGIDDAGVSQAT